MSRLCCAFLAARADRATTSSLRLRVKTVERGFEFTGGGRVLFGISVVIRCRTKGGICWRVQIGLLRERSYMLTIFTCEHANSSVWSIKHIDLVLGTTKHGLGQGGWLFYPCPGPFSESLVSKPTGVSPVGTGGASPTWVAMYTPVLLKSTFLVVSRLRRFWYGLAWGPVPGDLGLCGARGSRIGLSWAIAPACSWIRATRFSCFWCSHERIVGGPLH